MKRKPEYRNYASTILQEVSNTLKGISLTEKKPTKKEISNMTENEKFVVDSWNSLKNRTKVFETIPLIYALHPDEDVTAEEMISVLNTSYDWDKEGKTWILGVLNKIKKDDRAYQTFIQTVVEAAVTKGAPSLKDLNGGKMINDFIHGSITKFYASLKKNSPHNKESKTFTADVVVLWGPGSASTVINGSQLKNMEPTEESLVLLADKKTLMACVSLKALEGRVGKVTTLFQAKFGNKTTTEEVNTQIDEGVFSGVADMFSKAIETAKDTKIYKTIKDAFVGFTDWVKKTFDTIKNIFSPNSQEVIKAKAENEKIVDEADALLKEFDKELEEHYSKLGKPLTEASDDESIQISSCFREQLMSWYSNFEKDAGKYNKVFNEFKQKVSKYSTANQFRLSFTSLPEKERQFLSELKRINDMVKKVKSAKTEEAKSKRMSCLLLLSGTTPLTFTRRELKNILMSNANYVSISLLNNMIDQYLTKSKSLKTNDSIQSLIEFATELNAEAIFGAATEIPLIKYNGSEIIKFGSRSNYEKTHSKKMAEYFVSIKTLPIIGLKIYPPKSKDGGITAYYSIIMYSLSDYTGTESTQPSDKDFKYNVISFKCNSGSDFTFAVESDATVTGDKIVKALSSDELSADALS